MSNIARKIKRNNIRNNVRNMGLKHPNKLVSILYKERSRDVKQSNADGEPTGKGADGSGHK